MPVSDNMQNWIKAKKSWGIDYSVGAQKKRKLEKVVFDAQV